MEVQDNELLLIYNSNIINDRKAHGYAESAYGNKLKAFDIAHDNFTGTQYKDIADRLGVTLKDLINKKSDVYINEFDGHSSDDEGTLKMLENRPAILNTPIAVYAHKADFVDSSYEFIPGQKMDNTGK